MLHWTQALAVDATVTRYRSPRETVDLVVGLDFGTSSAKVVVRSPYFGRGNAVVVKWPDGEGRDTFLLPTTLQSAESGGFQVPADADFSNRDLKVDLLDRPGSRDARALAAAYLAWVLRTSRQYVLDKQADVYGKYVIRWAVNLGIPSAGYDDDETRECFLAVGRAAWRLSLRREAPTMKDAVAALLVSDPSDQDVLLEVVPEIVAEVAGYARARERRDGLHVIVDVGASTIDVCGFVLHERQGDDRYELLTALVERLDVLEVHVKRLAKTEEAGCRPRPGVPSREAGPFAVIPQRALDYVERPGVEIREALNKIDDEYLGDVTKALVKLFWRLRKLRDPLAPHWRDGLQVFVTGGGRGFDLVGRAGRNSEDAIRQLAESVSLFRYRALSSTLDAWGDETPSTDAMERLGVAYGLSFPDIGSIRPPHKIDDVIVPPKPKPQLLDYWAGKR